MSFSITTRQFKERTKTVTRRLGWGFLRPGDVVCGVEKAMGLKKGEHIVRLGPIEIVSKAEVILEGFPEMTAYEFILMFSRHMKVPPNKVVNRIAYKYLDEV